MFIVTLFIIVIVALLSAAYWLMAIDNYLYRKLVFVYNVIIEKIAIGTWFSESDLLFYSCESLYIRMCLKRLWEMHLLSVRNAESKVHVPRIHIMRTTNCFNKHFVATHQFQFLPSDKGGFKAEPDPAPEVFIVDDVMVGA